MASLGPWSKRPDEMPAPESNIVRGPWGQPQRTSKTFKAPKATRPRGGREPIINNWGMLVVFLLLWFVLPPVATWFVHLLANLFHAPV